MYNSIDHINRRSESNWRTSQLPMGPNKRRLLYTVIFPAVVCRPSEPNRIRRFCSRFSRECQLRVTTSSLPALTVPTPFIRGTARDNIVRVRTDDSAKEQKRFK